MLIFLKLGGSLITDKSGVETARTEEIARLSGEIAAALHSRPDLLLVIGHGSGSFGHSAARQYSTRSGVHGKDAWVGFSRVAHVASRLNAIVLDALHEAGVPALRFQPSASAVCREGTIMDLSLRPLKRALEAGLVPLVYGDVAIDEIWGGTIISTEEILAYLAHELTPTRILIAGDYDGVLDEHGQVVPTITPPTLDSVLGALKGSVQVDVTGGMASKVTSMLSLCKTIPGLEVRVFSGKREGNVFHALVDESVPFGTRLAS